MSKFFSCLALTCLMLLNLTINVTNIINYCDVLIIASYVE